MGRDKLGCSSASAPWSWTAPGLAAESPWAVGLCSSVCGYTCAWDAPPLRAVAGQGEANRQHLQMTEPGPSLASLGAGWLQGRGGGTACRHLLGQPALGIGFQQLHG